MKYQVMPDLTPIEYEALKADIAENGVLVPVEVDEQGELLDGHHRVRAWQELTDAGAELADYPRLIRVGWSEEQKRNHARRLNVLRRHLSKEQRDQTMVAMRADGMTLQEVADTVGVSVGTVHAATENNFSNLKSSTTVGKDGKERPQTYKPRRPKPTALFAPDAKSQDGTLGTLADLKERAPDLYSEVAAGEMKPTAAQREANHRDKHAPPPLPSDKYRVIYADPPWPYGNSGVITESDNYGRAARHYPSMSIDELCQMGDDIRARCAKDAVLFMWVTSPLLEECFDVIHAWGFQYKTSFVWDKIRHNFGHYNSVRHELLLVCTRGSCTPDNAKLYDSVVSLERSDKHSEKPEEFRQMIDSLYTWGKRIELFARTRADGWEAWGNEPS